jgi:hypothetical protein
MGPDNWFPDRISRLRFTKLPSSVGSCPDNELYDRSNRSNNMQFPTLSGMMPNNWFPDRISWLRFTKLPTSVESCPDNELYDRSKYQESWESFRIEPLSLFVERSRTNRFFNFPETWWNWPPPSCHSTYKAYSAVWDFLLMTVSGQTS